MHAKPRQQSRGAVQKAGATFIGAWIPNEVVAALDREVQTKDSDRSKVIRRALRDLLRVS